MQIIRNMKMLFLFHEIIVFSLFIRFAHQPSAILISYHPEPEQTVTNEILTGRKAILQSSAALADLLIQTLDLDLSSSQRNQAKPNHVLQDFSDNISPNSHLHTS